MERAKPKPKPKPIGIDKSILSEKADEPGPVEVFEHWLKLTWSGKGKRPLLSEDRKKRIRARLAEGFTVEQLQNALTGYRADAFFADKMEIAFRLGKPSEVERGLAKFEKQAGGDLSEYVRPVNA